MKPGDSSAIDERLQSLGTAKRAMLERRLMETRGAAARRNAIGRRPVTSPAPLSYSQELLWLLSHVFYGGVAYNSPAAFRLKGALDADALRQALEALVQRHEILRTTYRMINDQPMQVIADHADVELRQIDLGGRAREEQEAEVQRILSQESLAAFDLVNGPVMRQTLIRLEPDEHVFLTVLHHIATDGYSRAIFYSDLTALYEAIVRGMPSPLSALAIQYADYAVWHRNWLEGGALDEQLSYWKQKLAGAPSRLDLPTDFSRPPIRSYVGDHESLGLGMPVLEGLRTVARKGDATLFVGLVAVFAALLQRYSGQDDVVIGTPFAGRNRAEFEGMIGYFINPLALRVDLAGDPTFGELIGRARETTIEAFANADLPYEMIVRATNPERDLSQTPVFQAMLVLHNPEWLTQRPTFQPEGIQASEVVHGKGWSKFDVLVGMSERANGLNTTWEYSTELFKPDTVRRMMEHFRTLAGSAAMTPERRLSKLSMLSDAERSRLLVSWNAPDAPLPERDSVKELFEEQAARTPESTAVVFEDQPMTYDQLNRRANRLAWLLRERGAGPGTLVGIMLEKSLDSVAAVLAAMKAGATYVPLDPNYPTERIELMLADAQPKLLLTSDGLIETLPATEATVITVDSGALDGMSADNPPTEATGDDLAYVIFTSGSTGVPKGAMISNRSLASAFFSYESAYALRDLRCHVQLASFSFDVFTGDVIRSLLTGAKLVLCPLDVVVDPQRLYALMVQEGVDAVEFVPATATLLFDYAEREGKSFDFMRLIAIGGEAWRNEKYTFFKTLCGPQTRLINSYGLTEATMDSTWFEPPADAELPAGRFVPIGRPFANTRIYVLDANLEPTPIGIPGELCIGGVAVGRGYLNRPELTAERFVPDPFSDEPDARLYRTGDLARRRADGTIEFVGRADRQLKIRGFRVEPGEIEAVLERHPGVQAAAVTTRDDNGGDPRLVAYVTPTDPARPPVAGELYDFAAERVPVYMVPAAWMVVDAPPLTPNGKIDVDALPAPEWERSATDVFVAPRTDTEQALAAIWSEVLSVEDIGVTDNFFVLGGHSLLAVRVFAQIEQRLGKRLPLTTLFRAATIEQLAAAIDGEFEQPPTPATILPVRTGGSRPPLFVIGGIDGEVMFYRELVDALNPEQPVYGLQPEGLDGHAIPKTTIEEIAADYVRDVIAFRPVGPYLFAGYCYSGYIAFEVARQLYERGTPATMLALIDTGPGLSRPTRVELERRKFRDFRERDLRGKVAWITHRSRGVGWKLSKRLRWAAYDIFLYLRLPMPEPLRDLRQAGFRAWTQYRTKPAPIKLTLFRAVEAGRDWTRIALWSQAATGGVDVVPLHGAGIRHDNLLQEPYVGTLAAGLEQLIELSLNGEALEPEQPQRVASA